MDEGRQQTTAVAARVARCLYTPIDSAPDGKLSLRSATLNLKLRLRQQHRRMNYFSLPVKRIRYPILGCSPTDAIAKRMNLSITGLCSATRVSESW